MKRLLSCFIAILMTDLLFAQTENYKITIDSFQANYNTDRYHEIINCFSLEMKKSLPVEKTKEFLAQLKIQGDDI